MDYNILFLIGVVGFFLIFPKALFKLLKVLAIIIVVPAGALGITVLLVIKREVDISSLGWKGLLRLPFEVGRRILDELLNVSYEEVKNSRS